MNQGLSHFERFKKSIELEEPDRVPYGFGLGGIAYLSKFTGLPYQELFRGDGKKLAAASLKFQERFDTDYIVIVPDPCYLIEGWGQKVEFKEIAIMKEPVIKTPEEWEKMGVLDPKKDAAMPIFIEAVRACKEKVKDEVPVGGFLFTPTGTLMSLRGAEEYLMELLTSPESYKYPMQVVAETTIEFGKELFNAGADFVFYLPQASADYFTLETYKKVDLPFDLEILNALRKIGFPYVGIHTCQKKVYFDLLYEKMGDMIEMWNLWDKGPHKMDLKTAKEKFGKDVCLVSGLDQVKTLTSGTRNDVENEVKESIKNAAAGGGLILSPGCALSLLTPTENLDIVRQTIKNYGNYPIQLQ